jgi:hypothetical protein
VVNVYHGQGAGGVQVRAPKSGWPPRVVVRLLGFASLASFTAESTSGRLSCAAPKAASGNAEPACQLGNTRVEAISKRPDYLEVILPASLLKIDSAPIEIRWVERA